MLLELIEIWPQFIHHIIINNLTPFNQIIQLTQTCKTLHQYFHKMLKAHSMLCKYQMNNVTDYIFKQTGLLYQNSFEQLLFQKIFLYAKNRSSIDEAALNGYIIILRWYSVEYEVFLINAENGWSHIITLSRETDVFTALPLAYSSKIIDMVAANGHTNILDWFYDLCVRFGLMFLYSEDAIKKATINGHIDVLKWFYTRFPNDTCYFNIVDYASANGHVHILEWVHKSTQIYTLPLCYTEYPLNKAAERGHINVLDWFYTYFPNDLNYSHEAVDYASSYDRIDVLEWFLNLSIRNRSYKFKYSEYAINSAADRGHVDVLEWFYNLSYQSLRYLHYLNKKELEDTARLTTNAIPIIPITKLSIDCGVEPLKFIYSINTIDYVNSNGRINTLDWWWSHRSNLNFEYSKIDTAACKNHFDVLDWYFDKYQNYSEFKFKYTSKLVDYASIKLLDWLFDRSTYKNSEKYAKKIKFKYTKEAMFYTIMESRLHIIDWYLDKHATYGLPFKFDEDIVTHLSYLEDDIPQKSKLLSLVAFRKSSAKLS